jgi:hypothetical protein
VLVGPDMTRRVSLVLLGDAPTVLYTTGP